MSGLVTLVVLIVAAFVASAGLRTRSSYGLFSGAEYLLLGIVIGPLGLALVDEPTLAAVRPSLTLATAWVGLLLGLRQHRRALVELGVRGAVVVLLESGGTLAVVGFGLPVLAQLVGRPLDGAVVWPLAIVAAASTKATLAWARQRLGADGPTTRLLDVVTRHDDIPALAALAVLAALHPPPDAPPLWRVHAWAPGVATVGLGAVLGVAFTLLGGRRPERGTAWVTLIGVMLLAAGLAARLSLPAVVVCFVLGCTMALLTADATLGDDMVAATERPVVLLLLMLVGTRVRSADGLALVVGGTVGLRLGIKMITGRLIAPLGARTGWAGAGLLGFGGVALALAAEIDRLYDGTLGAQVLAAAAALAIVGDLVGPLGLRAALAASGELPAVEGPAPAPALVKSS